MKSILTLTRAFAAILTAVLFSRGTLQAAVLTWDTVSGDGGVITGGSGAWIDASGNWNNGSTDVLWNNGTPDSAIFGGLAGTITLGGGITVGNMTFNAGTGNYTINGSGNVLTLSSSLITVNTDATIAAILGGSTGLTVAGTNKLVLTAASTFTGDLNINSGTLEISGAGSVLQDNNASTVTVASGATALLSGSANNALGWGGSGISGSYEQWVVAGTINNTGGAAQTIPFGGVTLNGGTLTSSSGNATYGSYHVNASSGVITANGAGNTISAVDVGIGNTTATISTPLAGDTLTTSSVFRDIGGVGALTKTGAGTMIMTGASTYTGATTISGGALQVDGSLASGSTVGVGTAGALTGSGTVSGNVTLTGSGVINKSGGSIGGTLGVTGGNWNGTGSVTGLVTSSSGTFTIGSGANLTANGNLNVTGGTLASGSGTSTITGSVNYTSASSSTFGGIIAGSGKTVTMNNASGSLTLSGTNTYTGGTNVTAGTIVLANQNGFGTGTVTLAGGVNFSTTGFEGNNVAGALPNSFVLSGGMVNVDVSFSGHNDIWINTAVSGTGGFSVTSGGGIMRSPGLMLSGAKTFQGGVTIGDNARVTIDNNTSLGTGGLRANGGTDTLRVAGNVSNVANNAVVASGATLSVEVDSGVSAVLSGVISSEGGGGGLTKNSAGILSLSGANTYTGNTIISAGTLQIGAGGTTGSLSTSSAITNNATLEFNRTNTLTQGTDFASVISGSGAVSQVGSGTTVLSGANTYTGATSITAGTLQVNGSLAASSTVGVGTAGTLAGSGTINGNATLTGSGIINLSGGTIAGTLGVTGGNWNGSGSVTGPVTSSSGTFTIGSGANLTANGNLNVTGGTLASGSGTSTITGSVNYTSASSSTFGGVIAGSGKTVTMNNAASTLTLSGASTYTGTTTVSAGVVNIQNATALGTVAGGTSVSSGAALQIQGGIVVGAEALTLNGTGVSNDGALRTISGTNTYGGLVTLGSSTRINSDAGSTLYLTNTGTITGSGFDLTAGGGGNTTIAGIIGTGTGAVTKDGAGDLYLTGANTYTGTTTISGGRLVIGSGNTTGSLSTSSAIVNNATLAFWRSNTLTQGTDFASVISGSGAVSQSGVGTTILNGANTYTGATTVSTGVLNIQNAAALGTTAAGTTVLSGTALQIQGGIVVGAEALTLNGTGVSNDGALRTISGTNTYGGLVTLGSSTRINSDAGSTLYLTNTGTITGSGFGLTAGGAGNTTIAGIIGTGTGTLTKDGAGDLYLTGANTYTGTTTISGGRLVIGSGSTTGSLSTSSAIVNNATLAFWRSNTLTQGTDFASVISGSGAVSQTGVGTTILNGANTYTGATTVSTGVLNIQNATALGSTAAGTTVLSGTALQIQGGITVGAEALTLNGTGVSNDGALRNISGTNTYGGLVTLGSSTRINSDAGSTLYLTNTGTITGSGFDLTAGGAGNTTIAGIIGTGTGAVTKDGAGDLYLTGANTYTGTTTISGGRLVIGSGSTTGSLSTSSAIVNNATLAFWRSNTLTQGSDFASVISGSGAVSQSGVGTTILNGANTYTGATTVSTGVLNIQNATALGSTAAGTTVLSGTALQIQGGITVGAEALTLNGTGVSNDGALRNISGTNTYGGLVTLGSSTRINSDAGALTLSNTGTITGSGLALTVGGAGNTTINSIIGTGTGTLTKDGAGTLTLTAASTYTGATTVTAGSLQVDGSLASGSTVGVGTAGTLSGSGTINGNTTLTGSGIINLSSGTIGGTLGVTGGSWNGTGSVTGLVTSSSGTFTIGSGANLTANGNLNVTGGTLASGSGTSTITGSVNYTSASSSTFGGVIAGSGKTVTMNNAASTLTLGGTNTYTGTTTVSAGILSVTGDINNSATIAVSGGQLTTSGADKLANAAAVTVSGGTLTVGGSDTIGTLTMSSGTIGGTATLTATTYDLSGGTVNGNLGTGTLNSSGTVALNGTAAATAVNVTAGTLTLGASNLLADGGTVTVSGGALALGTSSDTVSVFNMSSGSLTGSGTLTATTYGLSGGTVGANLGAGTINSSGTVALNGTAAATAVNVTAGTLTLGASSAVNSATTVGVSGGSLVLGASNQIGNSATVTVSGGTLAMGANSDTVAAVALTSGSITSSSGVLTSTAAFDMQSGTVSAILGGTAGLTKTTAGSVTLSGVNTYTGATTISAGTLSVGSIGNGGVAGNLGQASNAASNLVFDGGTLQYTGSTATSDRAFTINAGKTATIDTANGLTLAGATGAATTGALTKTGAGTLTLTGASTYSGTTTISAGTLALSGSGALSDSSAVNVTGASAVFNISGITASGETVGSLAGVAGSSVVLGGKTLTAGGDGTSTAFDGVISGSGGSFTKTGAGTLTLSGTSANTYTGTTTVSDGVLLLNRTGAAAENVIAAGGSVVINTGGTLRLGTQTQINDEIVSFSINGGTFDLQGFVEGMTPQVSMTNGSITGGASGFLLARGGYAGSGTNTVSKSLSVRAADASSGVFSISGGTTTVSGVIQTDVGGAAGISKTGAGTLVLSGANTFAGNVTVGAGILNIQNATGLGTTAAGTSVSNGATLQLQGGITVGAEALTLNGGAASGQTGALVNVSGSNTYGGAITVASSSSISAASGSTLTLTGGVIKNGTVATFNGGGTINVNTTAISGSSANSDLVIDGTTVNLNVANTYNGPTFIRNSGTLNANVTNALPTANGRTAVTFDGTGTSVLALGADQSVASLTSAGSATVTLNANTLTIGGSSGSTTFAGAIGGTGGLTKDGASTQILSANNGYTGATTISAGNLTLQGTYASSGFAISSGATLEFNSGSSLDYGTTTFSGAGKLLKTGTGELRWGGNAATFALTSGALIDIQGGLMVGGNFANEVWTNNKSDLNIASGAFFAGVEANVRVNALTGGGTLSTGYSGSGYTSLTVGVDNGGGTFSGSITDGVASLGGYSDFGGAVATGNLTKAGTGTQVLSGANTYSGTTTVSAGILNIQNATGLGTTAAGTSVTNGATLQLQGGITVGAEALTLNGGAASGQTGALVNVSGTNTYGGAITVASSSSISAASGSVLNLTGGVIKNGTVATFNGGGTINVGTVGISGASANSDLVIDGTTVNLNVANTYNGPTFIRNSATLNANVTNALPTANGRTAVTFDGTGTSVLTLGAAQSVASLTAASAATITLNANTLTVGDASSNTTFAGAIGGTGGLTKDGASTQVLSGSNGYSGTTTVSAGTLSITGDINSSATIAVSGGSLTTSGADKLANAAAVTVSGGTLTVGGSDTIGTLTMSSGTIGGTATLTATTYGLSGGTVNGNLGTGTINSSGTVALNGTAAAGTVNVTAGTLTLGASSAINSATAVSISGGSLALGASNQIGNSATVTVSGGTLALGSNNDTVSVYNMSSGSITGSGTLTATTYGLSGGTVTANLGTGTINSSGTVALNGTAAAGTVNVTAGTLTLGASSAINSATAVNISGGSLALGASDQIGNSASVTVSGGSLAMGTNSDTVSAVQVSGGNITGTSGVLTSTSTYDMRSGSVSAVLGGTVGLTKSTGGTVNLTNSNTYTGTTTVNAGTLSLSGSGRISDSSSLVVTGGTFAIGSVSDTVAGVQLTGGSITGSSGVLTSSSTYDMQSGSVSAILGGSVGLNKTTSGTVTLSGSNTYTGATSLTSGNLVVNGSIASSSLTTIDGGTLMGTGAVGAIQLNSGGAINPGGASSAGALSTGNISIVDGQLHFNIGGTGSYDQINTAGTINLAAGGAGAKLVLDAISGYTATLNNAFTLVSNDLTDAITGTFAKGTFGGTKVITLSGVDYVENVLGSNYYGRINYSGSSTAPGTLATAGNDIILKIVTPEITITESGNNQTDGGTYNFGDVDKLVPAVPLTKTFTIKNDGEVDLMGIVVHAPTGAAASDYTLDLTGTASTLIPGDSTTFTITFSPSRIGTRTAAIVIDNNDLDENPFNLALTGVGSIGRQIIEPWTVTYGGPTAPAVPRNGQARAIAVQKSTTRDEAIGVFATGFTTNADGNLDVYTASYHPVTGALLWSRTFDGAAHRDDYANSIVVDGNGDVIVTGCTTKSDTDTDVYVAKYANADGALLWQKIYAGAGGSYDTGSSVAVDASNNVFVTGSGIRTASDYDFFVASYSSAGGVRFENLIDGGNNREDGAYKVAVDTAGSMVIAGNARNASNNRDFRVVHLSASTGTVNWQYTKNGSSSDHDYAYDVVFDGSNQVVATGTVRGSNYDIYTVKLDKTAGAIVWEKQWNGPNDSSDAGHQVKIDTSGNVVLGGVSYHSAGDQDGYVAKYNGTSGALIWEHRFNGGAGTTNLIAEIDLDALNNVVATGFTVSLAGNYDVLTGKMLAGDGGLLWEKTYNGAANSHDYGLALAVSPDGNIFVAGYSTTSNNTTDFLVKNYQAEHASTQAAQTITFANPGAQSAGSPLSLSATASSGLTVYFSVVSGPAQINEGTNSLVSFTGSGTVVVRASQSGNSGYAAATPVDQSFTVNKSPQTISFILPASLSSTAQWPLTGVASSGLAVTYSVQSGPGSIAGGILSFSGAGDVVVRASQVGDSKYNAASDVDATVTSVNHTPIVIFDNIVENWRDRYAGSGAGEGNDIALQLSGNDAIAGIVAGYTTTGTGRDLYLARYLADGTKDWSFVSNTAGNDEAMAVRVDASGDVYVAGYTTGTGQDLYVGKYSGVDGTRLWSYSINGAGNGNDVGVSLDFEGTTNVVVGGYVAGSGTGNDFFAAKLDQGTGAPVWTSTQNRTTTTSDVPAKVVVGTDGSVALAGISGSDAWTVKLDAATGNKVWQVVYNYANKPDAVRGLAMDGANNVIIAAYSQGSNYDMYTAKYASLDGTLIWGKRYNSSFNSSDAPWDMTVDEDANVYVTGTSYRSASVRDGMTLKYSGVDGTLLWEGRFNGANNGNDENTSISLDGIGNPVVGGYTTKSDGTTDVYLAKHNKGPGDLRWQKIFDGDNNKNDNVKKVRVDPNGVVWMTGSSTTSGGALEVLVLRDIPTP